MAKQVRIHARNPQATDDKLQRVEVVLGSAKDIPIIYANQVVVNFTGTEFILSVVCALPDPFLKPQPVPKKLEGKVLSRYAFSIPQWVSAAKSINDQIQRLQAEGAFKVVLEEVEEEVQ